MFNSQAISSFVFTVCVGAATVCWLLLGYDSVGDPSFDEATALLLQLSVLLPFCASIWFVFEGNSADSSTRLFLIGSVLGWVCMLGWMAIIALPDMPGIIPVMFVFLFPMGMLYFALMVLSVILFAIGFAIGGFWRRVTRRGNLAIR